MDALKEAMKLRTKIRTIERNEAKVLAERRKRYEQRKREAFAAVPEAVIGVYHKLGEVEATDAVDVDVDLPELEG
jgi:hypothetical protein